MEDLADDPGAVDLGSVIELRRNGHQCREVDDHGAAGRGPRRLEHERRHHGMGRLEPRDGSETDPAEDRVEHPGVAGVVEHLPQQYGHRRRHHDGQIGQRREHSPHTPYVAHDDRHEERGRIAEDEGEQSEVGGVLDRGR